MDSAGVLIIWRDDMWEIEGVGAMPNDCARQHLPGRVVSVVLKSTKDGTQLQLTGYYFLQKNKTRAIQERCSTAVYEACDELADNMAHLVTGDANGTVPCKVQGKPEPNDEFVADMMDGRDYTRLGILAPTNFFGKKKNEKANWGRTKEKA